jgi:hypothetical protein
MNLDVDQLLPEMLAAAAGVLNKQGPKVRDYAENEFRKLLFEAQHLAQLKADGRITEPEAVYLMDLQRNAARTVLLTVEGLGILAVESAINAALKVVREAVNSAIGGWKIL